MRLLVVGGTGYTGRALLREAGRRGWTLTALALTPAPVPRHVTLRVGDRRDPEVLRHLAREGPFDAVVDLVAYHPDDTAALLAHLGAGGARLVHLSTVSVYARPAGHVVREEDARRHPADAEGYGPAKAACEVLLEEAHRDRGCPAVIVRAPPLFGQEDPVSRENFFLKRLLAGEEILVPADLGGRLSLLWVDDLARVLADATVRPGVEGHSYHVAQAESPTLREHVEELARLAAVTPRLRRVPEKQLVRLGVNPHAFPFAPVTSATLDCSRASRELGFRPTPYRQALGATVRWFLDRDPRALPAWPGRASLQSRLTGVHEELYRDAERRLASAGPASSEGPPPVPPHHLLDLFTGWGAAAERLAGRGVRIAAPYRDWAAHQPAGPDGSRAVLEAVVEPDPFVAGTAWLHCRATAAAATGYRERNSPTRLRFVRFSAFVAGACGSGGTGEEQVVLGWDSPGDRRALAAWLAGLEEQGVVTVPSLAAYGSLWLSREAEVFTGGGLPGTGAARRWAAAFAACRLLARGRALPERSGPVALRVVELPATVTGRGGHQVRRGAFLAVAGGRWFACCPREGRLWQLTPAAGAVLHAVAGGTSSRALPGSPDPDRVAAVRPAAIALLRDAGLLGPAADDPTWPSPGSPGTAR